MLLLLAGTLAYLLGEGSFRLLTTLLVRRWPTLGLRDRDGVVHEGRVVMVLIVHATWVIILGSFALMTGWNGIVDPELAIDRETAMLITLFGAILAWPLLFSLDIVSLTSPDLDRAEDPAAVPLTPELAERVARTEGSLTALVGDASTLVKHADFIERWLALEGNLIALDRELRECLLRREETPASIIAFAQDARARLDELRLVAIEADRFAAADLEAAQARLDAASSGQG